MRLSQDEKNTVDNVLYRYPLWCQLYKQRCEWVEAQYGDRSSSDFSDVEELGTTVQTSPKHEGVQYRIVTKKEQDQYLQTLKTRLGFVEAALECLNEDCRQLVQKRYFDDFGMVRCVTEIPGMSEWRYNQCIREIRTIVAPFVLGPFAPPDFIEAG